MASILIANVSRKQKADSPDALCVGMTVRGEVWVSRV